MDDVTTAPAAEAAEPTPESLLTKDLPPNDAPDGEKTPAAEASAEATEADASAAVPESPEGYALTFKEGVEVDQELLGSFQKTAHELGLTNGQAQKLGEMYAERLAGGADKFRQAQMDEVLAAERGWVEELKARPTYKADLGHAQRALAEFGSDDLYEVLDGTRMGSYPALFDFVAKVGRALAEPSVRGQAGSPVPDKPLYERMWPQG